MAGMGRWQFSLRRLFGTVALFSLLSLALQLADTDMHSYAGTLAALSVFPLLGAAFGSLFNRASEGTLAGVAALVVALLFILPNLKNW